MRLKATLVIVSLNLALLLGGAALAFWAAYWRERPAVQVSTVRSPTRTQVDAAVRALIRTGRADELYAFYDQFTGNRMVSFLLVSNAVADEVPIHVVFGEAARESGFRPSTIGPQNENGSRDIGVMGCNTRTFAGYTVSDLQKAEVNIPFGVKHLADKRKETLTWEGAVVAYNHGSSNSIDERHVVHLVAVLEFERELNWRFGLRFADVL